MDTKVEITIRQCLRCFYKWIPKKKKSVRCAGCHNRFWNLPRVLKNPKRIAKRRESKISF